MGKKSRRNKAPRRTRKDVDDALAPFVGAADEYEPGDRFRLPEEYGIDDQKAMARYCDETCQANDFENHNRICLVLACRWNGIGRLPLCLSPLIVHGRYMDKALIPNARARERIREELEEARVRCEK